MSAYQTILQVFMLFATVNANFSATNICSLLSNGTRIKDPHVCNGWIKCIDGIPYNGTCESNLFYDQNTYTCVNASNVKCVSNDPCATLDGASGFTADPYSCNNYYYCNKGIGTLGECGSGYNFDPNTTYCIRNYPCTIKINPDSYCNILPNGVFIKNPNNCNGYQLCWNGQVLNLTCPNGYYYNAFKGDCDYPQDVECFEASTNVTAISPSEFCNQTGIFVSDQKSCNGYYYCDKSSNDNVTGIILQHGICPNGRFFSNTNGGECVPRNDIVCNYNRCVGLEDNRIVLANETNDGCHGYTLCQDGISIGNGTCPNDGYFDEINQLCTTQIIDFPSCAYSQSDSVGKHQYNLTKQ